ncbi:farnesol dehydrogenase-like, partial [Vespula maculifrons]
FYEKKRTFNFYPAFKFASVAATEITQKELYGSKIRVTNYARLKTFRKSSEIRKSSISPGLVSTGIIEANNITSKTWSEINLPVLDPDDVANAIIYIIGTPQRVHITELIIRPFGEVKYE